MRTFSPFRMTPVLVLAAVLAWGAARAAEKVEPGEERLEGDAARAALTAIGESFRKQPAFQARVIAERHELFGERREEGELLVQRPDRVLRRFGPPGKAVKAMRLEGAELLTYEPKERTVLPRDFSQAPKALALARAALTFDVEVLSQYFSVEIFRKAAAQGKPVQWRLVLVRRPEKKELPLDPRVEARLEDGAPFFHEVRRDFEGADEYLIEKYQDLRPAQKLPDQDFDEPLLKQTRKPVEKVKEIP
jgi:hypothetical protein